jgi:hypothetical protein
MALALFSPRLRFAKSVARIDSPRREQYDKGATVPVAGGGGNACKTVGLVCFTTTARCARDLDCEAAVEVANSPFQHDTASCRWQCGKQGAYGAPGEHWQRYAAWGTLDQVHAIWVCARQTQRRPRARPHTHSVTHSVTRTVSHTQCHTHNTHQSGRKQSTHGSPQPMLQRKHTSE